MPNWVVFICYRFSYTGTTHTNNTHINTNKVCPFKTEYFKGETSIFLPTL